MSTQTSQQKHRTFSKRVVLGNIVACWLLLFWSAHSGILGQTLTPVFGFITSLIALYVGIGHMDFRKIMDVKKEVEGMAKESK